ncbi:uncharacterized protein CC84DRAFT_402286 [Paraphaeosphaeria sporulosa]|uniref:Uncharacterized protein n=1 Tax=Paraphaeosphaeria sporulosa TaxID=1460663 RepID=A0A177BY43_9PLEO|nr:uncharacterized protein CC84DRAFT_402286 [Paraphaeosphaeria sporulosa]OAF99437.1 hypothetical protein CC84DRAFT_402286 [Paraphaeosphaeria sporulosa]
MGMHTYMNCRTAALVPKGQVYADIRQASWSAACTPKQSGDRTGVAAASEWRQSKVKSSHTEMRQASSIARRKPGAQYPIRQRMLGRLLFRALSASKPLGWRAFTLDVRNAMRSGLMQKTRRRRWCENKGRFQSQYAQKSADPTPHSLLPAQPTNQPVI